MSFSELFLDEQTDLERAWTAARLEREAARRALPVCHTGPIRTRHVVRHSSCDEAIRRIAGWVRGDLSETL